MKNWFALDWWMKQSDGEIFRFPTEYFEDLDQCQARQRHLWTLKSVCTVVTKMDHDPDLSKPFLDENLKPIIVPKLPSIARFFSWYGNKEK
jgi:hypothetical protein